jgi:hypothetical protein
VGLHGRGGAGRGGGQVGGDDAVEDAPRLGVVARGLGGSRDRTGRDRLLGRRAGGDEDAESQKEHDAPLQTLPDQRGHEAVDGLRGTGELSHSGGQSRAEDGDGDDRRPHVVDVLHQFVQPAEALEHENSDHEDRGRDHERLDVQPDGVVANDERQRDRQVEVKRVEERRVATEPRRVEATGRSEGHDGPFGSWLAKRFRGRNGYGKV